ncbi:hypothetical protein PF005_g14979 [Phytophthora fragariae]|uniref:DUF4604 domain-containing protein n=1 Tax=Phytophthora fragariae TaxID=53985 RepID=A0A6A3RV99_9STRA|nr:hypothetical protein PF003_g2669 [Phytophthora fragariae]KAE8933650.1 hypothetical protein PF009_g16348 [Phytophthora fragariae]KAE9001160.1 hypothetical protein PF011_g13869 [Phytophthora fragariae]KAE9101083.1 hypothetical protein PF007_g15283 [Phytophthora fragariae]KAE9101096.1 hypothetical protein PF010_g14563 [Phytophthora fragariae]
MNDDWREDGSLKGLNAGGGGGKARGKGKGPQFTRVIPKFLQKYHQPPAIQAKFATLPKLGDDEEDEGLDEVQQAAIDEYLANKEEKKEEKEKEKEKEEEEETTDKKKTKTSGQTVVQMGKATDPTKKKKRKRTDRPTLSNKKLLSFSMDDE